MTIQSFDPRTLQVLHKMDAGPNYLLVNADLVKEAHDRKVAVLPWTVNEEKDMKAKADLGVDGIISDYPDRLIKLLGSYQQ